MCRMELPGILTSCAAWPSGPRMSCFWRRVFCGTKPCPDGMVVGKLHRLDPAVLRFQSGRVYPVELHSQVIECGFANLEWRGKSSSLHENPDPFGLPARKRHWHYVGHPLHVVGIE